MYEGYPKSGADENTTLAKNHHIIVYHLLSTLRSSYRDRWWVIGHARQTNGGSRDLRNPFRRSRYWRIIIYQKPYSLVLDISWSTSMRSQNSEFFGIQRKLSRVVGLFKDSFPLPIHHGPSVDDHLDRPGRSTRRRHAIYPVTWTQYLVTWSHSFSFTLRTLECCFNSFSLNSQCLKELRINSDNVPIWS